MCVKFKVYAYIYKNTCLPAINRVRNWQTRGQTQVNNVCTIRDRDFVSMFGVVPVDPLCWGGLKFVLPFDHVKLEDLWQRLWT